MSITKEKQEAVERQIRDLSKQYRYNRQDFPIEVLIQKYSLILNQ